MGGKLAIAGDEGFDGDLGFAYCVEMCGMALNGFLRVGFGGSGEVATDDLEASGRLVRERLLRKDGRGEEFLGDDSVVDAMCVW